MGRSATFGRTLVLLLLLLAAGCSARGTEAMRLLNDIDAGFGPSALKEATPKPERRAVGYAVEGRGYAGDLYLSSAGALAALVLVPGLAPEGKDDPRLVALAQSLARVRFAVLVPDLQGLRALKVRASDVGEIADAVQWLSSNERLAPAGQVGLAAISYAAGPALLATLEPRVEGRVAFFVSVGGYYDIAQAITFAATGAYRTGKGWRFAEANPYGKWVFVGSNAERMAEQSGRALLWAIAERKLDEPRAPIADLTARLGPDGQAVMALVENTDPDKVPALIEALPHALKAEIAALDPARAALARFAARAILIHGQADAIIPYTESEALHRALPEGQSALYLVDGLLHANADLTFSDRLVLWDAGLDLLKERDRLAGRLEGACPPEC